MNLRELKSQTYALLGDASQQKVNFGIVVGYLNIAQTILGNLLFNVDREKFLAIDSQTTTNAISDYQTPIDLREIVRVVVGRSATVRGYEATRMPARDLNAVEMNTLYRPVYPNQIWYNEMEGTEPGKTTVRIFPTPITGSGVVASTGLTIWYYRKPVDFHVLGTYDGVATGVGTTTTVIDTAAPYNTTATTNTDFWKYAMWRGTSGSNNGIIRRVLSQTPASSTFTFASSPVLPTATTTSDTFELDQMSILPDYTHYLMPYYAAALASPQAGMDGSHLMARWDRELEMIGSRLMNNIEVNIPGQVSQGAAARAQM